MLSGINITNMQDATGKTGVSALIYGDSGIGKTTLCGTLQGKTLLIDMEGGTSVLRGKDVDVLRIKGDLSNLKSVFDALRTQDVPYANVCFDSSSELEKFMLLELARDGKNDGMPSQRNYGQMQFKMREYFRALRDLRERGINVLITALEMTIEFQEADGSRRIKAYPLMSNRLAPEICGLYDIVGHMEISKGKRFIRLDPTDRIVAKDRIYGRKWCAADGDELFNGKQEGEKKND